MGFLLAVPDASAGERLPGALIGVEAVLDKGASYNWPMNEKYWGGTLEPISK